jgi:hypothetical protein
MGIIGLPRLPMAMPRAPRVSTCATRNDDRTRYCKHREQAKHDKPTGSTSVTGDRLAEAKRSRGADGLAGGHLGNIRLARPDTPYRGREQQQARKAWRNGRERMRARATPRISDFRPTAALEPRRCACLASWPDQFTTLDRAHFWIGYCATYTQTTYTRRLRLRPHFNTLHPRWPREDTRQICLMSSAPRRGSRSQAEAGAAGRARADRAIAVRTVST